MGRHPRQATGCGYRLRRRQLACLAHGRRRRLRSHTRPLAAWRRARPAPASVCIDSHGHQHWSSGALAAPARTPVVAIRAVPLLTATRGQDTTAVVATPSSSSSLSSHSRSPASLSPPLADAAAYSPPRTRRHRHPSRPPPAPPQFLAASGGADGTTSSRLLRVPVEVVGESSQHATRAHGARSHVLAERELRAHKGVAGGRTAGRGRRACMRRRRAAARAARCGDSHRCARSQAALRAARVGQVGAAPRTLAAQRAVAQGTHVRSGNELILVPVPARGAGHQRDTHPDMFTRPHARRKRTAQSRAREKPHTKDQTRRRRRAYTTGVFRRVVRRRNSARCPGRTTRWAALPPVRTGAF